ncbi:amidohydrolase [Natrarchaeobius halalkaliphilus]|uniref:Amidohydrolase n=1 Tax=Natrarchaeobius halalkaliphilus TaxID=1679091 RepID=A0A3N6LNW2_9EURY|nr:amidohydrolase family protein [Natrarchaeobius halalkaliphilus]RQG87887.1 amidohydrolase [Natrarchaeobius halalkaliphilus]
MASFTVTDADAHYLEDLSRLSEYLEDDNPWKGRFGGDSKDNREDIGSVPVNIFPASTGSRNLYGRIQRDEVSYPGEEMSGEDVPRIMAHLGLDNCVLLSQKMLTFARLKADDERANVLAKTYTEYMLDEIVDPDEGVYTMIPVPWQDPEYAVELLDEYGDEKGICGACMITGGAEPPMGNRKYDPIYEIAEKKDLAINFHTGGGGLDEFHQKGYEKFIETHTLGFLYNNASQIVSVVVQGVPEKFPDLKIAFQESGLFYVPTVMHRLDAEYLKRQSEAPLLEKRPSEYMQEFYYGIQPMELPEKEEYLEQIIEMIGGPDRLMYASDYPHWDYDRPSVITERPFLDDDEKRRILSGTAEEVFGI